MYSLFRLGTFFLVAFSPLLRGDRTEVDLSGQGWKLWRDVQADWQDEKLYPPGTDLSQIPANPPSGGWDSLTAAAAKNVAVPGTVEQYLYKRTGQEDKHTPGLVGVSWWTRTFDAPEAIGGKTVRLDFESARYRAEVYVNRKLVAYNLVEGTPFSADLTGLIKPGEKVELAVRITSPGGWWSWEDFNVQKWGNYTIPLSRGFSGITGPVKLLVLDPTHIEDVYVQNTPVVNDINAQVTLLNNGAAPAQRDLQWDIIENSTGLHLLTQKAAVTLPVGESVQTVKLSVPKAKLWDLDHPNLYTCKVSVLADGKTLDTEKQTFGFRWFGPEGLGQNAMLRLNGKRIVLRTAISWGLWGTTGIVPTPEMAERQIDQAKAYGLNMLNFHRAIGQPMVLNLADEKGLLYFEEPGCFVDGSADPFCELLVREKLLRMVKRDRSHPSLVIFNMINEQWDKYKANTNDALYANFRADMAAAHKLDPSRTIVLSSAWSRKAAGEDELNKLAEMPFSDQEVQHGWWDYHRAGGPECWRQSFYSNPDEHYGNSTNTGEIVYWGEEGAISSPPRLALIKKEVEKMPQPGWDGEIYLDWYKQFDEFLSSKNLRAAFPDVDHFCLALGKVAIEHQGRKIEDTRICDVNDGYAVNGWEAEPYENHSGIVDCFRFPKGDPRILAYYNEPLHLAVKTRNEIITLGASATVDYFIVNETNLHGTYTLKVAAYDPGGQQMFSRDVPVTVSGGDIYGQLLAPAVSIPMTKNAGLWKLKAGLVDAGGRTLVEGHDEVLVVDWQDAKLKGRGAVYETGSGVHDFLANKLKIDAPEYSDDMGPLDWIVVARPVDEEPVPISPSAFQTPDGQPGVSVSFFNGKGFSGTASKRVDKNVDYSLSEGASPDPAISAGSDYCVRWEGKIIPPSTGDYTFSFGRCRGNAKLLVNGAAVKDGKVSLAEGVPVSFSIDYQPPAGRGDLLLDWKVPVIKREDAAALLARAAKDGTTIIIADHADSWMDLLKTTTGVNYGGKFNLGGSWLGGQYFAVAHPLFKELPTDCALNWPYQAVIDSGRSRYALLLDGEKLVAGAWQSFPMHLGTSVGIISSGKGKIVVSTLDICPHLDDPAGPADVARKLLVNYISFAAGGKP